MSLFTESSLCLVPSGVKEDKVYSIKPTDGSGDLTFSRGSDIEATRVASNGYIEKAKVNLLLQSNTFSTTWGIVRSSVTSGQSGYDGSSDAWLFQSTTTANSASLTQTNTTSAVQSLSVYAKAGTSDWLRIRGEATPSAYQVYFDLSTGSLGSTSSIIDASITPIGGGWYRCYVSANATLSTAILSIANGDNDVTTNSGDNIYIQDAQLNYGLVAQEYQETTTTSVVSGITNDMPRLDYSGGASCPSLLMEPSRTNLFDYSEYFNGSNWSLSNSTATENTAISPEGIQNASTFTTSVAGADLRDNTNVTGIYTFSLFVKLVDVGGVRLRIDASTDANVYFDLSDGSVFSSDGIIDADAIDYGNNWWRVYVTANVTNTQKFQMFTTDGTLSYANGSAYIYGAQLEAGSYPTSYIPTYGTSNSRNSEACSKTGISSLIGQTEGTLFLDFTPQSKDFQIYYQVRTTGSTNVGQIDIRYQSSNLRALGSDGGSSQFSINAGDIVVGQRYKCAVRYKLNDVAFYVDGALAGTDTSASFSSSALQQVSFNENAGAFLPQAEIHQALIFPTGLSNTELATLTA